MVATSRHNAARTGPAIGPVSETVSSMELGTLMDLVREAVRAELKTAQVEPVPMFMTKAKAARVFGVGITKFNELVDKGIIPTVEIDGSEMVSRTSLERLDVPKASSASTTKRERPPRPPKVERSAVASELEKLRADRKKRKR